MESEYFKGYMKIGDRVIFKEKVYHAPYAPYYDSYIDHFLIAEDRIVEDHVWLLCTNNPSIEAAGYVHLDEIELF